MQTSFAAGSETRRVRNKRPYNEPVAVVCSDGDFSVMALVLPAFAVVRPRVRLKRTGDTHVIEDIVGELAEELSAGVVCITGGPGSGKSTAIAHLAAIFFYE